MVSLLALCLCAAVDWFGAGTRRLYVDEDSAGDQAGGHCLAAFRYSWARSRAGNHQPRRSAFRLPHFSVDTSLAALFCAPGRRCGIQNHLRNGETSPADCGAKDHERRFREDFAARGDWGVAICCARAHRVVRPASRSEILSLAGLSRRLCRVNARSPKPSWATGHSGKLW